MPKTLRSRRPAFEPLEPRCLLSAGPLSAELLWIDEGRAFGPEPASAYDDVAPIDLLALTVADTSPVAKSIDTPYEALAMPTETRYWDQTNAQNGYTLFAAGDTTFLIDMEGRVINTWSIETEGKLLENGNLLAAATDNGGHEGFQELDWDGNIVWEYYETRTDYHPHGDVVRIFNSQLGEPTTLYIANRDLTNVEAIAAGCDPDDGPYDGAQVDTVVEVDMDGNICWEWSFFDHAVQDIDPTKDNYVGAGNTIADYPGKIDLNLPGRPVGQNWLDCNSLDYNASLDQIVINSSQGEFYVVDHGDTHVAGDPTASIAAAAGNAGDFLYRFGDPARYEQGNAPSVAEDWTKVTTGHKQLGGSHDVRWIDEGLPGEGHFLVFNNGHQLFERTAQSYIVEIDPFLDSRGVDTGSYVNPPAAGYYMHESDRDTHKEKRNVSNQVVWMYGSEGNLTLFSHLGSSVQRLSNGNTLICASTEGYLLEVTANGTVAWEYVTPVTDNGVVETIGDIGSMTNAVLQAYRYTSDHAAFDGRDMTPGATITATPADYRTMPGTYDPMQGPTELRHWNEAEAYNGYTLFGVAGTSYLLDMEGRVVNTWPLGTNPRLLDNGNLLDATRDDPSGFEGFREVDWNGNTVWEYVESRENYAPHHDWVRIFNSQLGKATTLYIANKSITHDEAIAAGCDPANGPYNDAQMDTIVEVDMDGNIVWEWWFFDHAVQDIDPTKANHVGDGNSIADHPGKINLNMPGRPLKRDWLHCNSLDYNAELDQIVINSVQGEFYVIDHGNTFVAGDPTASLAAAAGEAGDFLYRYGDPARYQQGDAPEILEDWSQSTAGHKQLGGSHDIQWIDPGLPGAGNFLIFNNGQYLLERTPQSYIAEINPRLNANGLDTGDYVNPPEAGYTTWTPDDPEKSQKQPKELSNQLVWNYGTKSNLSMFSHIGSGAQRLPNGNTLLCAMTEGHVLEVTPAGEIVWEYINPVIPGSVVETIGDNLPMRNSMFRAYRYGPDHPAFVGRDLTPGDTITGRDGNETPPTITATTHAPATSAANEPVWVTTAVTDDGGVADVTLTYDDGTGGGDEATVFFETMRLTPAKPWTGDGCDNAWIVTATTADEIEQRTQANYGDGNPCGLEFRTGTTDENDNMIETAVGIDATGTEGYVEFRLRAVDLEGADGWTFQLDSGSGYVTRLSEVTGTSHEWQSYRYDLDATELISDLKMRFQFRGGDPGDKILLDDISVVTTSGNGVGNVAIPMFDDGGHQDGAAGDGVYGAQIPAFAAGTTVSYYVEATDDTGNRSTDPSEAPATKYSYVVQDTATRDVGLLLGRPTDNSVAVSVLSELDLEVSLEYGTQSGVYAAQTGLWAVAAGDPLDATLGPLEADTQYYYRLRYREPGQAEFATGQEHAFHTQRASGSTFTFVVEADPHYQDNDEDVYLAALGNMLDDDPDFLVNLGDTFMTETVGADTYAEAAQLCEGLRTDFHEVVGPSVPLLLVTGNHEAEVGWSLDNASPQDNIAVWATRARQEYYPGPIPGDFYSGSTTIDPYLLDLRDSYYSFEWGDAQVVVLDPFWYTTGKPKDGWDWTLGQEQHEWLEQTLTESDARHKFVFIHHLVGGSFDLQGRGGKDLSSYFEWGGYNEDDTWGFDTERPGWSAPIQEVLIAGGVDIVFHGHDHLFVKEDLDHDGDGETDLVYQACPQPSRNNYGNTNSAVEYGYTDGDVLGPSGHLRVTVSGAEATVEYVRAYAPADETVARVNGQVDYSYTIQDAITTTTPSLVINEFMADNVTATEDPDEPGVYDDWIEIYNRGDASVDMGGMYLTDDLDHPTQWRIPTGTVIPSGGHLLFWADDDQAQGDNHTNFRLRSGGEEIGLFGFDGISEIDSIAFGQQVPDVSYGREPDGSDQWRSLPTPTPGTPNDTSAVQSLVINEFMVNNVSATEDPDEPGAYDDWIEIHNPSDRAIHLGGMYLTDDLARPTAWRIPEGVSISAGGHVLFWADDDQEQGPTHTTLELGSSAKEIGLFDADGEQVIDSIVFGLQTADMSFGREHDGATNWQTMATATPGATNRTQVDTPPTIAGTMHAPALPTAADLVWVTATVGDDGGVVDVTLTYEGRGVADVPMLDDGAHRDGAAGDGIYGAYIPAVPQGTTVNYYITATDTTGYQTSDPAAAPVETYSYTVAGDTTGSWTMAALPDTGQMGDYTASFGEDSDYTVNPPSFTNNGNATVTDNVTGLIWQQADGGEMTWDDAVAYAENLTLGGHGDWRLPFSHELFSIVDHGANNPALNTDYFSVSNAQYLWTSNERVDDSSRVWVVNAGGGIGAHPKNETISAGGTKRFHVLCVRDPSASGVTDLAGDFTDNGDATVTDNNTGLLWQQAEVGAATTWEGALAYAESLTLAGYDDWRLPNIKELRSISDDHLAGPSIDTAYFPNARASGYWSSTTELNNPTQAWLLDGEFGLVVYDAKSSEWNVRCVRGGTEANVDLPDMVSIPAGQFDMGDHYDLGGAEHASDEVPIHTVSIDAFSMGATEITNGQYCDYLSSALSQSLIEVRDGYVYGIGGSDIYCETTTAVAYSGIHWDGFEFSVADGRDDHPMVGVRWHGAAAYCNWLSVQTGYEPCYDPTTWESDFSKNGYRLPTEAEWEYAARGGEYYNIFPWGNDENDSGTLANWPNSGDPFETGDLPWTTPVGFYNGGLHSKNDFNWPGSEPVYQTSDGSNNYGLYDMSGNVWEWTGDWYGREYYSTSPADNPTGPSDGDPMPDGNPYRVLRGGNWYNGEEYWGHARTANRNPGYYRGPDDPDHAYYHVGFRVALATGTQGVVEPGATLEELHDGFQFAEGPTADTQGNIFFSDIAANIIYQWSLGGVLSTFRDNSGGANGLFFDGSGNLLACEGDNGRLASIDPQGGVTVLADEYAGARFNEPNDLWIDPLGGVYFSDPAYSLPQVQDGQHVYYLTPDRSGVIRVIDDMVRPNGLIGTPDGQLLYVTDHGVAATYRYDIDTDGTLSNKTLFASVGSDGMTIDSEGNVYLTKDAVLVYDAAGNRIDEIAIPEQPTNVTFGGANNQTLFVTTRPALHSIRTRVQGVSYHDAPPTITDTTHTPISPTESDPVWVMSTVIDDGSVADVTLTYDIGPGGGGGQTTVFQETMATSPAKPWTGSGTDHAWTVTAASADEIEQRTQANQGDGNPCGMEFRTGTTDENDNMIETAQGIDARGTSGYVEFWVRTIELEGTDGWTFQLDSGGGYVTRLSELSGVNHEWQSFRYDLAPDELIGNLKMRFQFRGGDQGDKILLDNISVVTASGTIVSSVDVPMFDDGAHQDGAAGDGVYGAQIPSRPAGTTVTYYVTATDDGGNQASDPTAAPGETYSYTVAAAQTEQTVGLFVYDEELSYDGYTLFAPKHNTNTYLIDNYGRVVHSWTLSTYEPGQSVYLLENGNLLRTCFTHTGSTGGGEGGRIEEYDWDGNLVWELDFASDQYMSHHDIAVLPNGNILMLVVEKKTYAEVLAAGFDPGLLNPDIQSKNSMLPDSVVEIERVGTNSANVVWEWHVWDHLIQDFDPARGNYGVVGDHPELVDPNGWIEGDKNRINAFWNHMNSINYNAELDQIMLSVRGSSELWVIDHSTTTAEAASHSGGDSGRGGDLMYRWGNPVTYDAGTAADRMLFDQHDAQWIEEGSPGAGNILIFNNGLGRNYSSVDEIVSPVDANGNYPLTPGGNFDPTTLTWTYTADPPSSMYEEAISGAQRLPNGNTLICNGTHGEFLEVTPAGETVWHYINPEVNTGILTQGEEPGVDDRGHLYNAVFKIHRYSLDYVAFAGRDLTPGGFLELYPPSTGDFDYDGDWDVDDLNALTLVGNLTIGVAVSPATSKFDLNGDNTIDTTDLDQWLDDAATLNGFGSPYLRGDANLDGDVDVWTSDGSGDAQVLSSNLGMGSGAAWGDGDFNGDGDVDVWAFDGSGDAQLLSSHLGVNVDIGAAPAVDEAIKQTVTDQDTPDPLPAALDWQYEYESMRSKRAKRKDVEATVDLLFALDW